MATPLAGTVLRHIRRLAAGPGGPAITDQQLLERFVGSRDEAAFTALVQRHGAMVLGVCRRVLHHLHDAEDAFQATFLVLARKAAAIRHRSSVGGWLYQVAYRLALKAKVRAGKRRGHEQREVVMPSTEPTAAL